jgi:rod shape-determining protein MreD
VAGIVHAGVSPEIVVAGVHPDLLLVGVVLVTAVLGMTHGLLWAFVGGVTANLLVPEPLGAVPLALLAVVALVGGGGRLLGRLVWVYPVLATVVCSVVADAIGLLIFRLVGEPLQSGAPAQVILPAAFLNAAIAGILVVPARLLASRMAPVERPAW